MTLFLSTRQMSGGRHAGTRHRSKGHASRRCRFEQMEPRQLLAADLAVGTGGGEFGQTGGPTGSISGKIYATDAVANCESHEAANHLEGVHVELLNESGTVLQQSQTDEQGDYLFSDLIPGQYAVRQQMPAGFFEGASHVGSGGGIAVARNRVREILVPAGEVLAGYDFCDYAIAPEAAGLVDRFVVPYLTLSLQPTVTAYSETPVEPAIVTPVEALRSQQFPLALTRPPDIFGGSSRSLPAPEGIKAWDNDPFDSWFSTVSYWEIAAANQVALAALEPILREARSSSDAMPAEEDTASFAKDFL